MGVNDVLRHRIAELELTYPELTRRLNRAIEKLTGRYGTVTERTIHDWVSGKTQWPHAKQRAALQAVFNRTAEQLGFTPRGTRHPASPEDPVRRRTFLTSSTGTVATVAAPCMSARHTVGSSDVVQLRNGLDALNALDDHRGGHQSLTAAALAGAKHTLDLQHGHASGRVRRHLFSLAAEYTATAAWSCIDARELDRAAQFLDRALALAGMAQDSAAQFQVWNFISMMAYQRHRYHDAVAAAQAAQSTGITRRDPLFASLAHARIAVAHASCGERQAALRFLGHAGDSLARADNSPRPSWLAFYGTAELHALTAVAHQHLGEPEQAEGASHRALAVLPTQFRRNRALATARLAIAQLDQRETDQACATAVSVYSLMEGDPLTARMRTLLGDFHRGLLTLVPGSTAAREWTDRIRTGGTRYQ